MKKEIILVDDLKEKIVDDDRILLDDDLFLAPVSTSRGELVPDDSFVPCEHGSLAVNLFTEEFVSSHFDEEDC